MDKELKSIWKNDDVFGLIRHADTCKTEIVILKSKAITQMMEVDGMSYEEADEYYEYNIAGALGEHSYSCVDDTITEDMLSEMLDEDDNEIINPPYTGRSNVK